MSREIKFRAWDKIDQEIRSVIKIKFDQIELMQYTGLKDKNGVEIYEGDIIRYNFQTTFSNDECISQVIFDEFMFMTDEHSLNRCSNIEVIGNIHSNPELL